MLRLHQRATDEIREAAAWYEERSRGLGRRFVAAVRDAFAQLESQPLVSSELETITAKHGFRRVLLRDFPYIVIFELFDDEVFIYAVAHAARRPNYWRRRKRKPGRE